MLAGVSLIAAASDPRVKVLLWLDHADVNADFRHHVVEGRDTRFVGVYGYGEYVPGVDSALEARLVRQERVRFIEGTSDNITSPEHRRLVNKAERYATRYNKKLLRYLRGHLNA
jgi:hypothetical protein